MFDISVFYANWPLLLNGAVTTLALSLGSFVIGMALGALLCPAANNELFTVRLMARTFIDFFRTIPEIVPIVWLYACAPFLFRIDIDPVPAGLIALSLITAATFAEIFRAGLESISEGQRDAGRALGLSRPLILAKIIAPQIISVVVPPALNLFSDLVKMSSLLSLIGVMELSYQTAIISATTYRYLEMYTFSGAIYLVMISGISLATTYVSDRFTRYQTIGRH